MSRDLKPHIGRASGTTILKCDTSDLNDNATNFQAYVKTRPIHLSALLGFKVGLKEPSLLAEAADSQMVSLISDRDFGKETRSQQVILTPDLAETRVVRKFQGATVGEADAIQLTLGDASATNDYWSCEVLWVPVTVQEPR
jgi:hypothetical protein